MINDNVCIVISKESYKYYDSWCYTNGFFFDLAMNPASIKDYFAKKIQAVVRENAKNYPTRGIKCIAKCEVALDYMSDYDNYDNKIRACDVHKVYKALKTM